MQLSSGYENSVTFGLYVVPLWLLCFNIGFASGDIHVLAFLSRELRRFSGGLPALATRACTMVPVISVVARRPRIPIRSLTACLSMGLAAE